jgi:hypothetical protein
MTRDLTLGSLPENERVTVAVYTERFANAFQDSEPSMKRGDALDNALDLISQVWIKMGPQAGPTMAE